MTGICLVAAVAMVIVKSREEQTKIAKRYEQLLMDYPGLVMKFTLLVQAGMTVRKAFQKIALDYRKKRPAKPRYAYEEVMAACYEMDSGVSEAEAYRRFGERCGQVKYKTFATLLIQNLQKGSRYLSDMLEKESMEAWDERKRRARVLGEAAATKLLVPMVLMMIVVIALVMIPAILSF
jgi:tight adherence protein C